MKRGAGPLQGNSTIEIGDESSNMTENQIENSEGGIQIQDEVDQKGDDVTGPLDNANTRGEQDGILTPSINSKNQNKTQVSIMNYVKKTDRGDTNVTMKKTQPQLVVDENLFDTANNINLLRDMRGECVIKNMSKK